MFNFDKWIYKYDEIISNYETNSQDLNKADILVKIGNGYLELNDVYKSKKNNAFKFKNIYIYIFYTNIHI